MKRIICLGLLFFFALVQAKPMLLFIEGNIGVGKSTFANVIKEIVPAVITFEPCDEWQNISGDNLLHAFYKDTAKWACLFQVYVSMTRIRKQEADIAAQPDVALQIVERSWFSDRYCFGQMLYDMGKMNELEWHVFEQLWTWYNRQAQQPVAFVYLRADPEVCYYRLKVRARGEESGVPLDYLKSLHDYHERLFIQHSVCPGIENIPVLILDGSLNFKDDRAIQESFVRQILDFLKISAKI